MLSSDVHHGDILVSTDALYGADLWAEEEIIGSVFMSDALGSALRAIRLKVNLNLTQCRLVENI
jgi:hypothetical protein